jgi:hypothetical protein
MTRIHVVSFFAVMLAVPAVAAAGSYLTAQDGKCFAAGGTAYRLTASRAADLTIRVDRQAAYPDLRVALTDNAADADFVLIDDRSNSVGCNRMKAKRTIHIDDAANEPDLIVALAPPQASPPAYKVFVQSSQFSAEDAAALFAVMRKDRNVVARR